MNFSNIRKEVETTAGIRNAERLLYNSKGVIYDRNLVPFAGNQLAYYMVVDPRKFDRSQIDYLSEISNISIDDISVKLKKETPFVLKSYVKSNSIEGVYIYEGTTRYPLDSVSRHIIGYLDSDKKIGQSGIEKSYNDFLSQFNSKVSFEYSTNALNGMSDSNVLFSNLDDSKDGIILTLDKTISQYCEQLLEKNIKRGCAIIMNCNTGELLALTSTPGFDAEHLSEYLDSDGGEFINTALVNQTVGSVFKILISVSALCNGMEEFTYTCSGATTVNGRIFTCQNSKAHGEQSLSDAFSNSCNCYYISLGQLLGEEKIKIIFDKFGLDSSYRIAKDIYSESSKFPVSSGNLALANLSIGQGELMMSPLSICRLTAVVCNGGYLVNPNVYSSIYIDGQKAFGKEYNYKYRVLSEEISGSLKDMCIQCVKEGTGKNALPLTGGAGGKTASAQTGRYDKNGDEILNTYFTGFYPSDKPEYVITIFAEEGKSGASTCAPIFKQICDFIHQNY